MKNSLLLLSVAALLSACAEAPTTPAPDAAANGAAPTSAPPTTPAAAVADTQEPRCTKRAPVGTRFATMQCREANTSGSEATRDIQHHGQLSTGPQGGG